jgi:hypothetical protein
MTLRRPIATTFAFLFALMGCAHAGVNDVADAPFLSPEDYLARHAYKSVPRECPAGSPATTAPVSASGVLSDTVLTSRMDPRPAWAWVAHHLPGGWAGGPIFRGDGRPLAFLLKQPALRDTFLVALRKLSQTNLMVDRLGDAEALPVRWSYAELYDWSEYLKRELGGPYHIWGWNVMEIANRILIEMDSPYREDATRLEARLLALGIPCGLVVYHVGPAPRAT